MGGEEEPSPLGGHEGGTVRQRKRPPPGSNSNPLAASFESGRRLLRNLGVSAAQGDESRYDAIATIVCSKPPPGLEPGAGGDAAAGGTPPSVVAYLCAEIEALGLVAVPAPGEHCDKFFIKVEAGEEALLRGAETLALPKETVRGFFDAFRYKNREAFARHEDAGFLTQAEKHRVVLMILGKIGCSHAPQPVQLATAVGGGSTMPTPAPVRSTEGKDSGVLAALQAAGEVECWFPLHSEKGRKEAQQQLKHAALAVGRVSVQEVARTIHNYFDSRVALYFGWLIFYTRWLFAPAAAGVVTWAYECWLQPHEYFSDAAWPLRHAHSLLFASFIVMWASLFLAFWERTNARLLCSWGIDHRAPPPTEDVAHFQRSEWGERLRVLGNNGLAFAATILIALPIMGAFCFMENQIVKSPEWAAQRPVAKKVAQYVNTAVYTVVVQVVNKCTTKIALWMNHHEGHVDPQAREDSLIVKMFGFHAINVYISAFYFAFWRRDLGDLRSHLRQRLVISQVIGNLVENGLPLAAFHMNEYKHRRELRKKSKAAGGGSGKSIGNLDPAERQYFKTPYASKVIGGEMDGVFDDFLEMVVQLGFILLFASAFPLASLLALLNNVIEIQTDAFRLLRVHRCPTPAVARTIGAWSNVIQTLVTLAIFTNCGLVFLAARAAHSPEPSGSGWLPGGWLGGDAAGGQGVGSGGMGGVGWMLVVEHALLLATAAVRAAVPRVPRKVLEAEHRWEDRRHAFRRLHRDPALCRSEWAWGGVHLAHSLRPSVGLAVGAGAGAGAGVGVGVGVPPPMGRATSLGEGGE